MKGRDRAECVRQIWYSVPARYAGRRVDVRLGAETFDVLGAGRVVASHARLAIRGAESLVLDHDLESSPVTWRISGRPSPRCQ
jgi:hypothetical protein